MAGDRSALSFEDWLREHGLERYAPTFRANDVDFEVIRALSESDLKELGLTLGSRKRFLAAVADLPLELSGKRPELRAQTPSGTERRQLTVMFCDLVGSVALAEQLDPEKLRKLVQEYRQTCHTVIARFDGHVARHVGDGLLIYFGWPEAHEDDAERATRAALAVRDAVRTIQAPYPLAVHVGIATGPVVVGQQAGESAESALAIGTTPNLAARLQALAGADQILISAATRRLNGSSFELCNLGRQPLKGIGEPVEVWEVVGDARTASRFEAVRAMTVLTPLIGRDEETGLLMARWRLAAIGEGQVVLLSGEAGVGKSRLIHRLREDLGEGAALAIRWQCSPHHVHSPLYPIVDQLERLIGTRQRDSVQRRLEQLYHLLEPAGERCLRDLPVFAALLSLPLDQTDSRNESPERQKSLTFGALQTWFEARAARRPLLIVCEDAHWIDAATQEFLDALVPQLARLACMLIVSCRPEYAPSWAGLGHVTTHVLNRLTPRQASAMVVRLGGDRFWPPELLEQIVANADGVPLFVEELSRSVLESGIVRPESGHYALAEPLRHLEIPATLKDSLMARLDRLGSAKELAQIGAAIGREFDHALLAAASSWPAPALHDALALLVRAQLIFRIGGYGQERYQFKHALIQDAAYQALITTKRHDIHERIAQALVASFPGEVAARPEIVAFHFAQAGLQREAFEYWQRAGELALSGSNYVEATNHLHQALSLLEAAVPEAERDKYELDIRVKLGPAYQVINGMGSIAAGDNYARACEVGARVGDNAQYFQGLWGHWLYANLTGRSTQAKERAEQLVVLSRKLQDDEFALQAHHARWTTFQNLGQLAATRFDIEQGLRLYDPARHAHHAHRYGGHDPGVCCRAQGGMCAWVSGFPDRADKLVDEGVALARTLDHPFSLAVGLWFGGSVKLFRGDDSGCHAFAAELLELSRQRGFTTTEPHALFQLGWARAARGETSAGMKLMQQGEARLHELGQHGWRHFCLSTMANVLANTGDYVRAIELVEQAINVASQGGVESWRPEFLRQRAHWSFAIGRIGLDQARADLEDALALARVQTARSLELRILSSLVQLLARRQDGAAAVLALQRCLEGFAEGASTPDIESARDLLVRSGSN